MKQNKETIKSYFETGDRPTQEQYHDTWDSFWHKDEVIPVESIEESQVNDSLSLVSTSTNTFNVVSAHIGGMNDIDQTSQIHLVIQDNATENIPVGSTITYNQINDGSVIVTYSGGATGDSGRTYKKGDVLTLWHKSLDNWVILSPPSALGSTTEGEPEGSDQVYNIISLTQAEYNAGTPVATTLYNITDA